MRDDVLDRWEMDEALEAQRADEHERELWELLEDRAGGLADSSDDDSNADSGLDDGIRGLSARQFCDLLASSDELGGLSCFVSVCGWPR